jgi:Bcr/CflA subfamily drug resistance transporter
MHHPKTPFLYIACLSGFSLITFDLYQPALPNIIQYFHTTHELGQLTLSFYLFIQGLAQLFWGPLIDHFGRLKCLTVSLSLFIVATIVCIFASSIYILILGRVLQSFFGCCSAVVAFSSTRDYDDTLERAKILSYISMVVSISPVIAPLFGAIVFLYFGWQATFICMAVAGMTLLFLAKPLLLESPYWLKKRERFSFHQSMRQYSFILSSKHTWIGIIILTGAFANIMIFIVNSTYLIIQQLHYSPTIFALIFACNGIIMILSNFLGIRLREYFSLRWNMCFGSLLMIVGSFISLIIYFYLGFNLLCLVPLLIVTCGVCIANPPALSLALMNYPDIAGSATAILNTMRMSLSALIAAGIGILLTKNVYIVPLSMMFFGVICLFFSALYDKSEETIN